MQTNTNRFNTYKKLCQIVLASAILGNVCAYAAPNSINGEETKVGTEATTTPTDTGVIKHKEGMASREKEPAVKDENNKKAIAETKPTVLFVCGGNTGRSFMSKIYTEYEYGEYINVLSRASGIGPGDDVTAEPNAKLLLEGKILGGPVDKKGKPIKYASKNTINAHVPTQVSITDIYNANVVLTMEEKNKQRLIRLIDRECDGNNIYGHSSSRFVDVDLGNNPDISGRSAWDKMCANKEELKAKIHNLVDCSGDTENQKIVDAYGKEPNEYIKTFNVISTDIDKIMSNTKNQQQHAPGKMGLSYRPNPYANIQCIK